MTSIAPIIPITGIPQDEDFVGDGDAASFLAAGIQEEFSAAKFSHALRKSG